MRILVHRPKGMRYTMLRQELLEFFDWNHCAALIAHSLEQKTAARLDDMEASKQKDGLLWVQVSAEFLYEDMMRQYANRTIRECLKLMEQKGVIVSAATSGTAKHILYNYALVDDCVTNGTTVQMLPDVGQSTHEQMPGTDPGNFAGVVSEATPAILPDHPGKKAAILPGLAPPLRVVVKKEEDQERVIPPKALLLDQNLTPETNTDPEADAELEAAVREETSRSARDRRRRREVREQVKAAKREARHASGRAITDRMQALKETARAREEAGRPATIGVPEDANQREATEQASTGSVARNSALPEEAEIWNEVVVSGAKFTAFDWEMQEGLDLRRCWAHPKFSLSAWRTVCEKAEVAIQNECGWVTFRWLVKKNDNWWKVMQGEYDTYRPKNKPKTGNAVETLSEKVTRVQNELARSKAVNG